MEIIYLLIPLSLVLVVLAVLAFSWATKNGQFDDLDSPALYILDDDHESLTKEKEDNSKGSSGN